jgi:hypothetical protein
MVAHPQQSAPSSAVAAAVRRAGGRRALAELIEVERARPRGFRDVTSPTEAYDLLLDREVVGQVIHDETRLQGMPQSPQHWVLVQRDADYSLAAQEADDAIAKARSIVAGRLAETAENPSAAGQVRRRRARFGRALPALVVGLALAVVAGALLTRDRG